MAGGNIGGQGGLIKRAIWVFISCCIVVAVWNTFPHDPKGFWNELGNKSEHLKSTAGDVVDWLDLSRLTKSDTTSNNNKPAEKNSTNTHINKTSPQKHNHKNKP